MKKDLIFAPVLFVIGILLFLLKATGMPVHIAVSVVGIIVLAVYTFLTKKEWKIPALEVLMRLFYGIALITGIVVLNVQGILALAIAHKVCAVLFLVLLIVLLTTKLAAQRRK